MKRHNLRDSKGRFAPKSSVSTPVKPKRKSTKKKVEREVYNIIILDESGSMSGEIGKAAVEGFNRHIDSVVADSNSNNIKTYSSLYIFNSCITNYSSFKDCRDLAKLQYGYNYNPRSSTDLYRTVTKAINDTLKYLSNDNKLGSKNIDVTITMFTDGEDTDGGSTALIEVKNFINGVKEDYNWTVAFIGAGNKLTLLREAAKMGIHESNVLVVEGTKEEIDMAYSTLSSSRSAKTAIYAITGVSDSIGFFQK